MNFSRSSTAANLAAILNSGRVQKKYAAGSVKSDIELVRPKSRDTWEKSIYTDDGFVSMPTLRKNDGVSIKSVSSFAKDDTASIKSVSSLAENDADSITTDDCREFYRTATQSDKMSKTAPHLYSDISPLDTLKKTLNTMKKRVDLIDKQNAQRFQNITPVIETDRPTSRFAYYSTRNAPSEAGSSGSWARPDFGDFNGLAAGLQSFNMPENNEPNGARFSGAISPESKALSEQNFSYEHPAYGRVEVVIGSKKASQAEFPIMITQAGKCFQQNMLVSDYDEAHNGRSTLKFNGAATSSINNQPLDPQKDSHFNGMLHMVASEALKMLGASQLILSDGAEINNSKIDTQGLEALHRENLSEQGWQQTKQIYAPASSETPPSYHTWENGSEGVAPQVTVPAPEKKGFFNKIFGGFGWFSLNRFPNVSFASLSRPMVDFFKGLNPFKSNQRSGLNQESFQAYSPAVSSTNLRSSMSSQRPVVVGGVNEFYNPAGYQANRRRSM